MVDKLNEIESEPVLSAFVQLTHTAESVAVRRPLKCLRRMKSIRSELTAHEQTFQREVARVSTSFDAEVEVQLLPSTAPTQSLGRSLRDLFALQKAKSELLAVVGHKEASALGILAIYISLVSLAVAISAMIT